ncbi:MAG TPA: polymer-forming cytoskeletal protein [Candidatus Acidoferrales bacterium]|nr:polymer-forming cytoskeletal protein [Candidatus Acidoferrales bacterium]
MKQQSPNQGQSQDQPQSQPQPYTPPSVQRISESTSDSSAFSRPGTPSARNMACIGASLEIKGRLTADEDLQIDGKIEGPVSVRGHRLTVGRSGQLNSEVTARELVVFGKVTGNVNATDRVEIKKDGGVIGDIQTTRISIEDGAIFKGRIEIDRPGSKPTSVSAVKHESVGAMVPAGAD